MGQVNKKIRKEDSMGQVNKKIRKQDSMGQMKQPQSPHQGIKCEVFLSYSRGKDAKNAFSSHLYSTLKKAGISVIKSYDTSIELLRSIIEGSKISIVIFSVNYVSSKRCLEELTKIMEFRRAYDPVVLPIFCDVFPSDVRNQESSFGDTFQYLIQNVSPTEDTVSRWRSALNEAGGYYGFAAPDIHYNGPSQVIQNVVKHVRYILDTRVPLVIDSGPFAKDNGLVGVHSQVKEVITMLEKHRLKDFVSIGIWGMAGIGKTTIANLIFDHIRYEFERKCFLSNVKETWESYVGKAGLQRKLRSEISYLRGPFDEDGIKDQEKRLKATKVLVVLDDVNDLEQLQLLSGNHYARGSRTIITTRDLHLLKSVQVDEVYSVKLLNDHNSLQLFNSYTLKQESPEGEFIKLSRRVVVYTEGLPLALEVLGSFLNERSQMEWDSALMKLSTDLPRQIYDKLKLSFDSLDGNIKEIFLNSFISYWGTHQ